tara:strand:+ start:1778 stop:2053 length:276 start_codon:yes stop_codon:yes gene_type:complete
MKNDNQLSPIKVTGNIPTKPELLEDLRKVITMTLDVMNELSMDVSIQINKKVWREKVISEQNKQFTRRVDDVKKYGEISAVAPLIMKFEKK